MDKNTNYSVAEDDLSIVASDEDGSSADGANQAGAGDKRLRNAPVDLVRRETRLVMYLRYIILMLLLTEAILFSILTFRTVKVADENNASAGECSVDVDDSFVQGLDVNLLQGHVSRLSSAFSLSASISSFVLTTLKDAPIAWPLVTVPHFEPRTTGILQTTGAMQVVLSPLVDPVLQSDFEAYAVEQLKAECSDCDVPEEIFNVDDSPSADDEVTSPIWQIAPFTSPPNRLLNQLSDPIVGKGLQDMQKFRAAVWTDFASVDELPVTTMLYPVYQDFNEVNLVGSLAMQLDWQTILQSALPFNTAEDYTISIESCSGQAAYFNVVEGQVQFDGFGEVTDQAKEKSGSITLPGAYVYGEFTEPMTGVDACAFTVWVASATLVDDFVNGVTPEGEEKSNRHIVLTVVVVLMFFVTLAVFLAYDFIVEKRQSVVVNIATKSSAIVENLFPAQVRDRMLQNLQEQEKAPGATDATSGGDNAATTETMSKNAIPAKNMGNGRVSVKQFLSNDMGLNNDLSTAPIADLFPNTTVLFADIAGFTAWSSQREPPQVFTLLETLYRSFDVIAGKLKVFKVETIGDCYMAVTGLPNPDEAHAVHMSRFSYQCMMGMKELLWELEAILGPGTSDLALRSGLHSGAVTAGVLRGEKSRFQLFGDTVNTASRMESTGERGRIQVSQETADLLMAAGKSHWLKARDDMVVAKGKGELKTYWLDPTKKRRHTKNHKDIRVQQEISLGNGADQMSATGEVPFDAKYARLIDWNVDVLLHHLARVISCRSRSPSRGSLVNHSSEVALLPAAINDVAEVVALPPFDPDASRFRRARPDVSMLQQTRADLHEYVKRIALMYQDVPFHNFEHASHVTLCANKLLNRLINSDEYETEEELHDSTFGISSDPLTHFAIVFAALIHDADHTGLPNAQLVKDNDALARKFDNRSVAEQNSVHLGWELLMDPRFERLRKCIYQTNVERKRFRQLAINSVMATDIADRQVNENRQTKWDKAFRRSPGEGASVLRIQEDMNRKATAVIEHIIQVSDVAHTMQHWHIYRRWNERLFHEMHEAFQSGKVNVDPSTNWYIGELGFFDYYLIPLAMKLKECGVFGASGYEYISYVLKNKKEWERKGRQVVQEMVLLYKDVDEDDQSGSSMDSEYDSDDLGYDSPGGLSSTESEGGDETDERDIDSMDPV
jgi:class 3 adenylate cyclase